MASFKRARSPAAHDLSPSSSAPSSPTLKAARTSATPPPHEPSTSSLDAAPSNILCTLPPTCNPPNRPTSLAGTRELEAHYAMYHAHVCEEKGCGCVFPDARLLELVSGSLSFLKSHPSQTRRVHPRSCTLFSYLHDITNSTLTGYVCYRSTRRSAMTRLLQCAENAVRRSCVCSRNPPPPTFTEAPFLNSLLFPTGRV